MKEAIKTFGWTIRILEDDPRGKRTPLSARRTQKVHLKGVLVSRGGRLVFTKSQHETGAKKPNTTDVPPSSLVVASVYRSDGRYAIQHAAQPSQNRGLKLKFLGEAINEEITARARLVTEFWGLVNQPKRKHARRESMPFNQRCTRHLCNAAGSWK